ncbi:cobaltochelatase CobT-related protein [Piscinibacter sakaiensis]|uniref:Aerobic cobaltochelatase, CobT subunit n=1 Tax=Piscinibacter sakaiensis TaxID=1547922 RepID=A0A0K8P614_PISS1|nr:cobalt chelatase [Piscinibacter sakaiensis]GAP37969.1 aerobic cobaltochelatase, CobT subunit [Piscinibacter sakaiensis]
MTDAAVAEARLQQQVEELCVAAIRALAGEPDLHFRGRRLHRGGQRLPHFAPHLHPTLAADDFGSFRGAADGLALRLRHSDAALHAAQQPADAAERLVFDLLEQFRCESLADPAHDGVRHNLRHRHEAWSAAFHASGLTETARGVLLYALAQITRARITAEPVVEATEDFIESTRFMLAPRIGVPLAALRRHRADQAAFAAPALAIAREVGELLRAAGEADAAAARPRGEGEPDPRAAFQLLLDPDADTADGIAAVQAGDSRVLAESPGGYRVYTRAYDREAEAATLLRAPVLAAHRERLDRRVAAQGANLARLSRALQALLARPADDGWDGAQEQGRIDGRRLGQLIASPTERRLFREERLAPQADAALTLLVDCSGSMKAHAESVAMLAEILLRAAEAVGVQTELLGFSTGAWNGGRAGRDWQRAGRPRHPGRLNEALHLVFKAADRPWRHARRGIAALLEPTLFREGVDGEAVAWACARLRAREARRRLLVVVSDGCPMDTATQLANDAHYLDQALRETVAREEARGDVAIHGLGVGLDLSPYYGRCRAIDLAAPPGNALFGELLELLADRRRR